MQARKSFTGRTRQRKTRWLVRAAEVLSRGLITVGGIGTILAVCAVCVFLVYVTYPLFLPAHVSGSQSFAPPDKDQRRPLRSALDEYQLMGWVLEADGTLVVFRLDDGQVLERRKLFPKAKLTACSSPTPSEEMAFGFADGTVRLGRIGFTSPTVNPSKLPAPLRDLPNGQVAVYEGGLISKTPEGQFRVQKIKVDLEEPIKPETPSPVVLIDHTTRSSGQIFAYLTADGKLRIQSITKSVNPLTDEPSYELTGGELVLAPQMGKAKPAYLLLTGVGDAVFVVWADGRLLRINTRNLEKPRIVDELNLLTEPGVTLTSLQFLNGKSTLLAGDSTGRVRAWFSDGTTLVAGHEFRGTGSAVTALASSGRSRMMAAGYADGGVRLFYVTSEKLLADLKTESDQPVYGLALTPKDDGLVAFSKASCRRWELDPGHPEVTLSSLFLPVWYEGYSKPTSVWQTSSAGGDYEAKFGMWPLVFGTLKATFYSLLMGVPLALLGAIYTSEFLHPRAKSIVKPTIELMASLPSVVLGFLAALVFAPIVERILPAVLASFFTIPCAFLLGAYGWQLLPEKLSLQLARWRFVFICAVLPLGVAGAAVVGPLLERLLFHGDIKGWLDGHGPGTSGWVLLLLPLSAVATALLSGRTLGPWVRGWAARFNPVQCAALDLGKFLVGAGVAISGAILGAILLSAVGLDPRGGIVGTYVQRNALVVGFMMGFAIIPIIYTIAEDALSAVPEHLRSASLGCGATPWQTATRIIIPTAMSGLFSAVMIGLGRAVGETMIVLMATGNTPILEWNMFNGLRTLSATLAVELPEAAKDSTHFRTLFFAGLTLFAMTFVINSVAEMVRLRFRKRAYQL